MSPLVWPDAVIGIYCAWKGRPLILAAIIALAAIGLIVLIFAISHVPPEDRNEDDGAVTTRAPIEHDAGRPRVTIRRSGSAPAMRGRTLMVSGSPAKVPSRRLGALKSWARLCIEDRLEPWARRTWSHNQGEVTLFAIIVASSVVIAYVIVHI